MQNEKYLQLLQEKYPNKNEVITEIINLEAILNLPKATEHFVSDLHGEFDSFQHVLRNGSGAIKEKATACFQGKINPEALNELLVLIYYPEEVLKQKKYKMHQRLELEAWYQEMISYLIELIQFCSSKYTRSKVRKALPTGFTYIIEELLYKTNEMQDKKGYYASIIKTVIELHQARPLISGLAYTLQRLVVDHLHVVGDIYDRGPAPDKIMDTLQHYHSVDIQWGNHDITWLGAVSGSKACMMNVIRICARYDNLDIIEDAYGINLRPLLTFAEKYYADNFVFHPKKNPDKAAISEAEKLQITKIHQAATILQFKLEAALYKRRPEFLMAHRQLLDKIDYKQLTIELNEKIYALENTCFQTININEPESLSQEEELLLDKLLTSFQNSEKLCRHMDFLIQKGSLYLCYNDNLLFHGCVPLHENGDFKSFRIQDEAYSGKKLFKLFEKSLNYAYLHPEQQEDLATDMIWYLWTGECSTLFGKKDMTTFERYFISDTKAHYEKKNAYYFLRNEEKICQRLLKEFNLDPEKGHIVNGHTPVKEIDGENPIKAGGKLIVIDGGYSKAYQKTTGIAGYTLIYNSFGMQLAAHNAFSSKEDAIQNGSDIVSIKRVVDRELVRKKVRETNIGKELIVQKEDLENLLHVQNKRANFLLDQLL